MEAPVDEILTYLENKVVRSDLRREFLQACLQDAYKRLIASSIENEIRAEMTEKAEDGAITVFGKNLSQLLMQPPIIGKRVLGFDPAFRTGCKLAVVDPTGKVLDTTVIYPTAPQNKVEEAKAVSEKFRKEMRTEEAYRALSGAEQFAEQTIELLHNAISVIFRLRVE